MITVDETVFADLKKRAHQAIPDVPSSKLAEILAAALGYRTHASLRADIRKKGWIDCVDDEMLAQARSTELGITLPSGVLDAVLMQKPTYPLHLTKILLQDLIQLAQASLDENEAIHANVGTARGGVKIYTAGELISVIRNNTKPAHNALFERLEGLGKPAQIEVTAAMWIGRGDYGVEDWVAAMDEATENWDDYAANYIAEKSLLLAEYLSEAAAALKL
jgi:hypothetical protein